MIGSRSALLFLVSAGIAFSSPLQGRYEVYTVKDAHPVPRRWTKISDAPSRHVLKLEIALKQGRFDELDRQLMEGEILARSGADVGTNASSICSERP